MSDSDASKEKPTALGKFAASIEQIFKIATALVALTYVFGVVVLNIHLGRYGYHSLGLLQLDYVAAGFWSLAPITMAGLLVFIVFYVFAESYLFMEKDNSKHTDWSDKIKNILVALILWGLIVFLIFWLLGVNLTWHWLVAGIIGFFVGAGLVFLPIMIAEDTEEKHRILAGVMLIWCIVVLPFYLIHFGRFVYQTIPDVWGGGRGTEVVLIAKDDGSRVLIESVGVQFVDARKSVPVRLIWATEKEIVIVPAQQQLGGVKLDNSLVIAVVYSK